MQAKLPSPPPPPKKEKKKKKSVTLLLTAYLHQKHIIFIMFI